MTQNKAVGEGSQSLRCMKNEAKSHATNGTARENVSHQSRTDEEMYNSVSTETWKHMSTGCGEMRGNIKRGHSKTNWQT